MSFDWSEQRIVEHNARVAAGRLRYEGKLPAVVSGWQPSEIQTLREAYASDGGVDVAALAIKLNRTHAAVACKAGELGLSSERGKNKRTEAARKAYSEAQKERYKKNPKANFDIANHMKGKPNGFFGKSHSKALREETSDRFKEWHKNNPHPRGMLGKTHSKESREAISRAHTGRPRSPEQTRRSLETKLKRYGTLAPNRRRGSWKADWVEIADKRIYARSSWEANYARFLQWQKERGEILEWHHEPETFWFEGIKRGCVSYLPDFKVTTWTNDIEYHEVKGWMDAASKTKIKRMAKYHPSVKLVVIDSTRYRALAKTCKQIVKGWI